jgi:hypothetical protein
MKKLNLKPHGMTLLHRNYLWLLFFLIMIFIGVCWSAFQCLQDVQLLAIIVTAVCGSFYILLQQHVEQARFFKELVTEFNSRYDKLNDTLLFLPENKESFNKEQVHAVIDYFNLCAEEFLFYEAGYIDKRIWEAWYNGMKKFGKNERIAELWRQEISTDSYYGFEFPCNRKNDS